MGKKKVTPPAEMSHMVHMRGLWGVMLMGPLPSYYKQSLGYCRDITSCHYSRDHNGRHQTTVVTEAWSLSRLMIISPNRNQALVG